MGRSPIHAVSMLLSSITLVCRRAGGSDRLVPRDHVHVLLHDVYLILLILYVLVDPRHEVLRKIFA